MTDSARNRRSIVLGGSAIALILLWVFAITPFFDRISLREQDIANNAKLIRKYSIALDEDARAGNKDADTAGRMQQVEQRLFKGKTIQLAAADVQKIVDGAARQSELSIRTVRVMDSEIVDSFVAVPIQVIFESDLTRLTGFISLIENNPKLLTIPELQIRVKNRRQPREITVTMKIAGYMKKEETGT
jgi:type II secretory pathway component PulM